MKLIQFKTISSTQDYAIDLIKNEKFKQSIVITSNSQTTGRGRYNQRVWVSENGNFHGSFIINIQNFGIIEQNTAILNQLVIASIFDVLINITKSRNLKFKLQNDIYYNNKKLGGVLIEVFYPFAIIGIGINLSLSPIPTATDLYSSFGIQIDPNNKYFINLLYDSIIKYLYNYKTIYNYSS